MNFVAAVALGATAILAVGAWLWAVGHFLGRLTDLDMDDAFDKIFAGLTSHALLVMSLLACYWLGRHLMHWLRGRL